MNFFESLMPSSNQNFLFGQAPRAETVTQNALTPEQLAMLSKLLGQLGGTGGAQVGSQIALPKGVQSSLAALEAQSMNQANGGITGNAEADTAFTQQLSGEPQNFEQYYQDTVAQPMVRDWNEKILPGIQKQFGGSNGANFYGSDRTTAVTTSARDLQEGLTRERSNLAFKTDQDARTRQLQALGLLPGQASANAAGMNAQLTPMQLQQQQLQQLISLLGVDPYDNAAVGLPGQEGAVQGFLKGFGQGLGSSM